jgi:hypothetical protein
MSNPGPIRPPTNDPRTNVLMCYMCGCIVAIFCIVSMAPGAWRLVATTPGLLGLWIGWVLIKGAGDRTRRDA